jgi:hypothetical protein
MAEVKNAFIKSKMNKDLDARLIPQGEYRDAVNIQVSKSEGDDVGALENVLGNVSRANFEAHSGVSNLTCIGYFVSEFSSKVYLFFTDYTDLYDKSTNPTYNLNANNFIYECDLSSNPNPTTSASIKKLVEGAFLNFSSNKPIIGVNLLEDFLFFTDNRNQPRKINVALANQENINNPTYYSTEDNISVAKYYPYEPISLVKESTVAPGSDECAMYDAFSEFIPLNNSAQPNVTNPYYDANFPGDPKFLEDKFVRFSYRFKFEDGEYSLIAPFTQPCFTPKQDGYFLEGDEQQTFASTVVDFMENKVNKIDLQIPLPVIADDLKNSFHVSEVDIIYKESDGLALQVVETIQAKDITGTNPVFEYVYLSQKPYKTLPEDEITRVYDKIPVKALGQEVISNRVVYSNFQDKHTPPKFIKYQVGANEKYEPSNALPFVNSKTTIEYPNHTLKRNRNYQIGVVLSDRYGRQSTVILSNDQNPSAGGFGADTIYLPYRDVNDSITYLGDSLKMSFNEPIQSNKNQANLTPGLYNNDVNDVNYNPLGWHTFKIVVKQVEQEYYNVYTAGAMKGLPYNYNISFPGQPGGSNNTSFVTLINDNINKVPRDLSEVGPQDKSFRSSVVLFGRVNNTSNVFSNIGNEQYIPTNERLSFTTNVIEDLFDLFDVLQFDYGPGVKVDPITSTDNAYHGFYKSDSNPFIAEFITTQTAADQFGVLNSQTNNEFKDIENLAIFETAPTISRLDLYYETSTSGLIEDLNNAVGSSSGGVYEISNFEYSQNESYGLDAVVATGFKFLNFGGVALPATVELVSVLDDSGSGINRKNQFTLSQLGSLEFELRTNSYFYYGENANINESYVFTFKATHGTDVTSLPVNGNLENTPPTINNENTDTIQLQIGDQSVLTNLSGVNGSADPTRDTLGLTFSIDSSTGAGDYIVVNNNEVQNKNTSASGSGSFTLRLTDAGSPQAGTVTKTFDVVFDEPNTNLPSYRTYPGSGMLADSRGAAVYLTNDFTNLTSNIPNSFGNISYNSNGYNTSFHLKGLVQNLSSSQNPNTRSVCDPNQPGFMYGTSSNIGGFYNEKIPQGGLTTGVFYLYFNPYNSQPYQQQQFPEINFRYQIAYRANSNSAWATAIDMNGNPANFSGTWFYNSAGTGGLDSNSISSNWSSLQNPQIVVTRLENNYEKRYAGLVYAFNIPGEYRILHSNMASTFGKLTPQGDNQNGFSCSQTPYYDSNMGHVFETGDFYYPHSSAGGVDNTIAPNSSDPNNVFRYKISQGNCNNTPTINVYAREPVAKYVTQLYTDQGLNNKFGSSTSGTSYVIRRMESLSSFSSTFLNPEYTNQGKYLIFFQNTTGLANPGSQTPCYT